MSRRSYLTPSRRNRITLPKIVRTDTRRGRASPARGARKLKRSSSKNSSRYVLSDSRRYNVRDTLDVYHKLMESSNASAPRQGGDVASLNAIDLLLCDPVACGYVQCILYNVSERRRVSAHTLELLCIQLPSNKSRREAPPKVNIPRRYKT